MKTWSAEELKKPAVPFWPWPKIHRWSREVIVTEKIDGTNAQVWVDETMSRAYAGSRTKWISPVDDNYGFAVWVMEHQKELLQLGPGAHFGEWWGAGIQRKYNMKEKKFSLFNVTHWSDASTRPACCDVVPILWRGPMDELRLDWQMEQLKVVGSRAAPGFMNPEGVVIFHVAGGYLFKKTFDKDIEGKGT
jgi:hypothetical protein